MRRSRSTRLISGVDDRFVVDRDADQRAPFPDALQGRLDGRRHAGGVERRVDAVAVGAVGDQLGDVDGSRDRACGRRAPRSTSRRVGEGSTTSISVRPMPRSANHKPDADGAGAVDQRAALVVDLAQDWRRDRPPTSARPARPSLPECCRAAGGPGSAGPRCTPPCRRRPSGRGSPPSCTGCSGRSCTAGTARTGRWVRSRPGRPRRTSVTPGPTSVTTPENSWPMTSGIALPVSGCG